MDNVTRPKEVERSEASYMTEKNAQENYKKQFSNVYDKLDEITDYINNSDESFTQQFSDMSTAIDEIVEKIYPVGAVYISVDDTSPATLFGGTWTQLTGRFLIGASSSYSVESTGGSATHTLTTDEMPAHTHTIGLVRSEGEETGYGLTQSEKFIDRVIVDGSGTSSYSTASSVGGGSAFSILPPYLAVYMWKRTA